MNDNSELKILYTLLDEIPETMCAKPQPEFLYSLARSVDPQGTIVEIGTCAGKSLISMAMARRKINGSKVISVDIVKHPKVEEYINRAGITDWTELIIGESIKVAKSWSKTIDLLFIDGDHRYAFIHKDLKSWSKFVPVNGIMAFHDYRNGTGVPRAIRKEILNKPWIWQVISDREYGSIFVVKRLQSEQNKNLKWHEDKMWWLHFKMKLGRNKKLKAFYQSFKPTTKSSGKHHE